MHNIFFSSNSCKAEAMTNTFRSIVGGLRQIIFALLVIYVIGYGANILMEPFKKSAEEYVFFVLKAVLVIYFTIGLQFDSVISNKLNNDVSNGMTEIALPILTSLSSDLSQIVLSAARSSQTNRSNYQGLCQFDPASYDKGYGYYALFDTIDCRIGYFLGYQLIYQSVTDGSLSSAATQLSNSISNDSQDIVNSYNATSQGATNAYNSAVQGATNAYNSTTQGATNAYNSTVQGTTNAYNSTTQGATNAYNSTVQGTTNAYNSTVQGATNAYNSTTQGATNAYNSTTQGATNAYNSTVQGTTNA
jgi:hypothetical protein